MKSNPLSPTPPKLLLLAAALLSLAACKESPSVSSVRFEIERQVPEARFEKEFHLRLGRMSLAMIRPFARWALAEDDHEARLLLNGVRRIDIGTYRVLSLPDVDALLPSQRLQDRLTRNGWTALVRTREDEELTLVFTREDEGKIRGLFVMALDPDEMVLVSLEGKLGEVLAEMVADDPVGFALMMGS